MKMVFERIVFVILMISIITIFCLAEEKDDFRYELLSDGTIEIVKYSGNAENVIIPSSIDGKQVSSIGEAAFWASSCVMITIPRTVIQIKGNPFGGSGFLERIVISNGNEGFEVVDYVLYDKKNLRAIHLPAQAIVDEVHIPNGIKVIESRAFQNSNVSEIYIPKSVEEIRDYGFSDNYVERFDLSDNTKTIGKGAFHGDASIKNIPWGGGIQRIEEDTFSYCVALEEIEIPDCVTEIGRGAFSTCTSLETVIMHEGLIKIEDSAFADCSCLKEIVIPSTVSEIGEDVFSGCNNWGNEFTVLVADGSYAQNYCIENGLDYRVAN